MEQRLAFDIDGGGTVSLRLPDDETGIGRAASIGDLVAKAQASLETSVEQVLSRQLPIDESRRMSGEDTDATTVAPST
jgi:hypothetical protein